MRLTSSTGMAKSRANCTALRCVAGCSLKSIAGAGGNSSARMGAAVGAGAATITEITSTCASSMRSSGTAENAPNMPSAATRRLN